MIPAQRIQKELQTEILPAYLLVGSDSFLRTHVIEALAGRIDPGLRDLNVGRFNENEVQSCLESALTLPMMSCYRLVILEDVAKIKDDNWERLYGYLDNPNSRTILLLVSSRLHESRVKKLSRKVAIISATEPERSEIRSMLERSFRKEGYQLDSELLDELLDQVGTDLQALSQEVEKLKLYRHQDRVISTDDVAQVSNRARRHEIWELTNHLVTRNRRKLLSLLRRLLDEGVIPLVLLKSIYSNLAGLLVVKELAENTESEISELTGMNPYYVRRLREQSRKFEIPELKKALRELHRTDSALKGSALPEGLLLEMLLIRIMRAPGKGT